MNTEATTIENFTDRVRKLVSNLPVEIARVNDGLALSIIPFIKDRIISHGQDGKGKNFGNYSTKPLPSFFFAHKGLGSQADDKFKALEKRKKKQEGKNYRGVSYKEFRELNNRPTDHITLSFSGETLNDLGVINNRTDSSLVITTIGALSTKTKAKYNAQGQKTGENTTEQILDYLGDRYGEDILSVNQEEEQLMAETFDKELQKLVNKYIEENNE